MTAPPSVTILELRDQIAYFLEDVRRLLVRGGAPLSRGPHYADLAAKIEQELEKVRRLELRMAVVAPMKAGKSTIINAILGQAVLPTRNSAMTSLPSEIVCETALQEPVLQLPQTMVVRFEEAWKNLHEEMTKSQQDRIARESVEYPEIGELARAVASSPTMKLKTETVGREQVWRALRDMSDLCRLATAIDPNLSPLEKFDYSEIPRIRTPFLRLAGPADESGGRVVIVDTPGPNEARRHEALQAVMSAELSRTSVVLLVLDFTQLNTQAAELVSVQVRRVVALVGEDNLLVLVNKIDERIDGRSMTPEDVRQFVASHLHLKGAAARNRVFEISAKQAFCAADFLRELKELGDAPSDEAARALPRASEFAKLAFGATDWEDALREAPVRELARRAEKLWRISKFDAFLTKALDAVMTNVAPRALSIALRVARAHLLQLRNDATIRSKGIAEDAQVLRDELDSLDSELGKLEQARKGLEQSVRRVRDELREQLRSTRRGLQRTTDLEIAASFRAARQGRESFFERLRRHGARFAHIFGFEWQDAGQSVAFSDPLEAEDFAAEAVEHVLSRVRPQIEAELERVDRAMEQTRRRLEEEIDAETRPIVLRAAERLKKRFDVRLEVPGPNLGNPLASVTMPDTLSQRIDGGYEIQVRWERKWYVLWLFEVAVKYRVKRDDCYIVSLEDVGQQVNRSIHGQLEETAVRFEAFLEVDFRDRVDEYFARLAEYLAFYRKSVENAQASQRLSLQEREKARDELQELARDGDDSIVTAERLQQELLARLRVACSDREDAMAIGHDVFFSYSHKDEDLRDELEVHLTMLKREGVIRAWHDRRLGAGEEWKGAIDAHLESASIVLLLVSPDFLASKYCYDVEAARSLERHHAGEARVIPVILRPCDWKTAPFAELLALPLDAKPVTTWSNRDEAFTNVAQGIRDAVSRPLAGLRR